MASLLERVLDVILRIDKQYNVKYVSKAGLEWLGGRKPQCFTDIIYADDIEAFKSASLSNIDSFECEVRIVLGPEMVWSHVKAYKLPEIDQYMVCLYDISAWKDSAAHLQYAAEHDVLTGLANRALLYTSLAECLNTGVPFALALLDLDGFKRVNDTFGHSVGDEVLVLAAARLLEVVDADDLVVRLGGDEFIVLFPSTSNNEALDEKLFKILHTTAKPYTANAPHEVYITCSIGLAAFPTHGTDQFTLLKNADTAMYMAKTSGKNKIQVYEQAGPSTYLAIETAMHDGISSGEFFLEYQPQFTADGVLVGAEALMRWESSKFGVVSPGKFIPIAEETGLVLFLGTWALRCACHQLKQFTKADPNFIVAVNVSPMQFRLGKFEDVVYEALKETGIPAKNLTLEMTESLLMQNHEQIQQTMLRLRQFGVKFAIDDFGTGFSSLSYLTKLPVATLKIDQSFVKTLGDDSDNKSLVIAILNLAHSISLVCVAEGVETKEQLAFLRESACDYIQGYLLGKPMSAESMWDLICQARRESK